MRTTTRAEYIKEIELEILENYIFKTLTKKPQIEKFKKDFFNIRLERRNHKLLN